MMNHQVGQSIIKPIDVGELFNRRIIICELESGLNDYDAIYISVVAKGETESSVVAEVVQEAFGTVGGLVESDIVPDKHN